jgi:hypothetical protein
MHLLDHAGTPVDSDFSLGFLNGEPCIVIESSGGASSTRPRRNPEYNQLVALLLVRLRAARVHITRIFLDSAKVAELPLSERLVEFGQPYPINLAGEEPEDLRKAIGRSVALMHRDPGASSSGNAQKRLRICLSRRVEADELVTASPANSAVPEDVSLLPGLTETERAYMRTARIGQGDFRDQLLKRYGARCPVTGIENTELLIASHIKPWRACSNAERLDPENGILLSALADKLFDRGLLSFSDDGGSILSPLLSTADQLVVSKMLQRKPALTERNREYLDYHRRAVFQATAGASPSSRMNSRLSENRP